MWPFTKSRTTNSNRNDDQSFASGELEYEYLTEHIDAVDAAAITTPISSSSTASASASASASTTTTTTKQQLSLIMNTNTKLMIAFSALVLFGTCNTIFIKLQAIPLYNYPNFINLFGCSLFVPILFIGYIFPVYYCGISASSSSSSSSRSRSRSSSSSSSATRRVSDHDHNHNNIDHDHDHSGSTTTTTTTTTTQQQPPPPPPPSPSPIISQEQWNMSKRPFVIMGALDCLACTMQIFAAVYLPGPLLVLLPQVAIPMSMIFSKYLLGSHYQPCQYMGAMVVLLGIGVVLLVPELMTHHQANNQEYYICEAVDLQHDCKVCQVELTERACLSHRLDVNPLIMTPDFTTYYATAVQDLLLQARLHDNSNNNNNNNNNYDDDEGQAICEWISATSNDSNNRAEHFLILIWSGIMMLSCIPMTLSTIYKEIVLRDDAVDPILLNGWIAVFQTIFSIVLAVPAGMASSPTVMPHELPENLVNGFQCYYYGEGSVTNGCHPDTHCPDAAWLFNVGIAVNLCFMISMMMVIKWGSTSLLFLGLTIMVPLGNLAFCALPNAAPVHLSDILGLAVILSGLLIYRFSGKPVEGDEVAEEEEIEELVLAVIEEQQEVDSMLREPLLPSPPRVGDV